MRLKSLTLKGFKSFPDRTRLDFGPGVSVVVGPNGSGKSNVTDAVLWAMGEQSPLAVRGQSMQDVIFGGGRGVQPRSAAEVEIVLDNSDGTVDLPLSEISIVRRLDRNGEGGYRLNGARCRLTDVIEVLSDTGLGKETHSVISQGRVDAIVTSKPRDRRLLIEEAAGLGKHRKRRRRAQLKLERTQENLDRALDVEREARSRLRPLKRQAEAAELHERLERQILQARWELAREDCARRRRGARERRGARRAGARGARGDRAPAAGDDRPARRGRARAGRARRAPRRALAAAVRGALGARAPRAARASRSARARRRSRAGSSASSSSCRGSRAARARERTADADAEAAASVRAASPTLEAELAEIADQPRAGDRARARRAGRATHEQQLALVEQARSQVAQARAQRAERADAAGRAGARAPDRRRAARCRTRAASPRASAPSWPPPTSSCAPTCASAASTRTRRRRSARSCASQDGYELALAAALGGRLDAALVKDVSGAEALLDRAGPDGGTRAAGRRRPASGVAPRAAVASAPARAGARGAQLLELLSGPPAVLELAGRLLADAWVVERLEDLPDELRRASPPRARAACGSPPGARCAS